MKRKQYPTKKADFRQQLMLHKTKTAEKNATQNQIMLKKSSYDRKTEKSFSYYCMLMKQLPDSSFTLHSIASEICNETIRYQEDSLLTKQHHGRGIINIFTALSEAKHSKLWAVSDTQQLSATLRYPLVTPSRKNKG